MHPDTVLRQSSTSPLVMGPAQIDAAADATATTASPATGDRAELLVFDEESNVQSLLASIDHNHAAQVIQYAVAAVQNNSDAGHASSFSILVRDTGPNIISSNASDDDDERRLLNSVSDDAGDNDNPVILPSDADDNDSHLSTTSDAGFDDDDDGSNSSISLPGGAGVAFLSPPLFPRNNHTRFEGRPHPTRPPPPYPRPPPYHPTSTSPITTTSSQHTPPSPIYFGTPPPPSYEVATGVAVAGELAMPTPLRAVNLPALERTAGEAVAEFLWGGMSPEEERADVLESVSRLGLD